MARTPTFSRSLECLDEHNGLTDYTNGVPINYVLDGTPSSRVKFRNLKNVNRTAYDANIFQMEVNGTKVLVSRNDITKILAHM